MSKYVIFLLILLAPAISFAEEIVLSCMGVEYIQTGDMGTGIAMNDKGFDVITMNTDSRVLRIRMSDNKFHMIPYNDDVAVLSGKYELDEKNGVYEMFTINRFNGNYIKKIVSGSTAAFTFVGMCMRGNKMF